MNSLRSSRVEELNKIIKNFLYIPNCIKTLVGMDLKLEGI